MLKMICPKCAMESAPADRCPICEGDTTKARKAAEAGERLAAFARGVILDANTALCLVEERTFDPTGSLDPESWVIMRHNAEKIVAAVENGSYIDPAWMATIGQLAKVGADSEKSA